MARKRTGRPPKGRDDVTVKLDRTLAFKALIVAKHRKASVAEVLSDMVSAPLDRAYGDVLKAVDRKPG